MDMEQEHNSLERSLGRVEGQLNSLVAVVNTLSANITSLSNDFATMEKGRLTALEVKFATLSTEIELKAKNSGMVSGAIISVIVSVASAFILYYATK